MSGNSEISSEDFEAAKDAVQKLGDDSEVQGIMYELDSLQLEREYYEMKHEGVLTDKEISRRLAKKFNRDYGSVQYTVRYKF